MPPAQQGKGKHRVYSDPHALRGAGIAGAGHSQGLGALYGRMLPPAGAPARGQALTVSGARARARCHERLVAPVDLCCRVCLLGPRRGRSRRWPLQTSSAGVENGQYRWQTVAQRPTALCLAWSTGLAQTGLTRPHKGFRARTRAPSPTHQWHIAHGRRAGCRSHGRGVGTGLPGFGVEAIASKNCRDPPPRPTGASGCAALRALGVQSCILRGLAPVAGAGPRRPQRRGDRW